MSEVRWLSEKEQEAWRAFQQMRLLLVSHLNRDLHEKSGLSDADYEVMVHLSEAPSHRMRLLNLGCALRWEKSRLSHQLSRMEVRGLVARSECPTDGRGAFFALTAAGWDTLVAAAPFHVAAVRKAFVDGLTAEELQTFGDLSRKIISRLTENEQ